jgi:hypothetical protein
MTTYCFTQVGLDRWLDETTGQTVSTAEMFKRVQLRTKSGAETRTEAGCMLAVWLFAFAALVADIAVRLFSH